MPKGSCGSLAMINANQKVIQLESANLGNPNAPSQMKPGPVSVLDWSMSENSGSSGGSLDSVNVDEYEIVGLR